MPLSERNRRIKMKDEEIKIEYRHDGKIPIGIWIVWGGFGIWAVYYLLKYALPDFLIWMKQM